jgi:hypothetical protein
MNKINYMKKLLLAILILLASKIQAQCDWSDFYMIKSYQRQNLYQFKTNLHYTDTCFSYTWLVYDYQLNRVDTIREFAGGSIEVQFNAKGKYRVGLHATDRCNKCDTNFVYNVDITIYGEKAKLGYSVNDTNCRMYTFEMVNMKDSCMSYYYEVWDATEFAKNLDDEEWGNFSDSLLYFTYDWEEKNLKYWSASSERILRHTFDDTGRYIITTFWQNKCSGIDTWSWNKITVCPTKRTTSTKDLIKNTDVRIIGYYDMMGRQVEYMRPNEVYIILYSNGQRRKVMQVQN